MRELLLALWLWAGAAAAAGGREPLAFEQGVQPERVELGAPFVQTVTITHLPSQRYELRLPKDSGAFELLKQERRREDDRDRSVTRFELKWAVFALGKQPLPGVTFEVFVPDEKPARFTPPPPEIEAIESEPNGASSSEGQSQPFDIRPPVPLAVRSLRALYAALALFAAVVLGLWGYRRYSDWRSKRVKPPPSPQPLGLRTRMALDALGNEKLPEKGRGTEFYFRLSELVRGYLGERYGFEALECTSEELLAALGRRSDAALPLAELEAFVRSSDWVKYAKAPADVEGCRQALAFAHRLIQSTDKDVARAERA